MREAGVRSDFVPRVEAGGKCIAVAGIGSVQFFNLRRGSTTVLVISLLRGFGDGCCHAQGHGQLLAPRMKGEGEEIVSESGL